jgi:hypothetical protein
VSSWQRLRARLAPRRLREAEETLEQVRELAMEWERRWQEANEEACERRARVAGLKRILRDRDAQLAAALGAAREHVETLRQIRELLPLLAASTLPPPELAARIQAVLDQLEVPHA